MPETGDKKSDALIQYGLWMAGGMVFLLLFGLTRQYWAPRFLHGVILDDGGFVWALIFYLAVAVGWWKRRSFNRRNGFRAGVLTMTTLLCLAMLEVVARKVSPPPVFIPTLPTFPNIREKRRFDIEGVSPIGWHSTNAWGLRGDPVPTDWEGTFTILAVGGSTTHCLVLDDKKTWPWLLQEHLKEKRPRLWIGNAGFNGHTTRGHLLVMRSIVEKVRPDALIFLVGINDLALSLDEKSRKEGLGYDDRRYTFPGPKGMERLRLYQVAHTWKRILWDEVPVVNDTNHSTSYYSKVDPASFTPLPDDLRTMLPSLPEYRANIRELIRRGRALNCRMLFLTQPMLFDDTPEWQEKLCRTFFIKNTTWRLSTATYWRMLKIFNAALIETCEQEGVPCFDLASRIPHTRECFYDMVHFTEAGAVKVAEEVKEAAEGLVNDEIPKSPNTQGNPKSE